MFGLGWQLAIVAGVMSVGFSVGAEEWQSIKSVGTQRYTPVFLATTPNGDVVAGTFNNGTVPSDPSGLADMPVILIHDPLSDTPGLFAVCVNKFPAQRGYSGIAVDNAGNFYVAADTGEGATCWIRKYLPDGKQDTSWGNGGQISDGSRFCGLVISGDYLITTAAFGKLRFYKLKDGQLAGAAPVPTGEVPSIRDIAADPSKQVIYGVAKGAVWVWEGGSFDNPSGYALRRLSADVYSNVSGEGIYFDAVSRKALVPARLKGELITVSENKDIQNSTIIPPSQASLSSVADAVLLSDGQTLFITDLKQSNIHVMKRSQGLDSATEGDSAASSTPPSLPPPAPTSEDGTSGLAGSGVTWQKDYKEAADQARKTSRPLIVYFRSPSVARCSEFESGFLKSSEFKAAASKAVPVQVDITSDAILTQQLGVYRVPAVGIYKPNGDRIALFQGRVEPKDIIKNLKSSAK